MFRMYSLLRNIINNGRRARGDKGLHSKNLKAESQPMCKQVPQLVLKIMITTKVGTFFQLHCTLNAILSCSKIKGAPDLQLPLS